MDWIDISSRWTDFTTNTKEQWGELTDDEIVEINGEKDQLVSMLQKRYNLSRHEAETQIEQWGSGLNLP